MEVDPDYSGFAVNAEDDVQDERSRIFKKNARDVAVEKIRSIISVQFDKEIEMKENELMTINQKLADARCIMDRLRACVVASFYAASFTKPVDGTKGPDPGAAYHPAIQNVMRKAVTSVLSKNAPPYKQQPKKDEFGDDQNQDTLRESQKADFTANADETDDTSTHGPEPGEPSEEKMKENAAPAQGKKSLPNLGGRNRIKKTIIVGNVSKYIPSDQREGSDRSTHKWMVYVRGSKEEPRIDHFVRKVWFFLHPSYRPNDLVEVCEAPFHLTRRGWGEFPVRVQIHFCDRRNKPVDIIHGLRLDRTYTGLQTLGAETVCEVELDRSSVQLSVDEILDAANLPTIHQGSSNSNEASTKNESRSEDTPATSCVDDRKEKDSQTKSDTKKEKSEEKASDEVKYSNQHQFQPVTTSCTISSDKVSPSRKRKLDEGADKSPVGASGRITVEQNIPVSTNHDVINEVETPEEDPSESSEDVVPQKRRRKRRRDSCRTSASEDEIPSDSNASQSSLETEGGNVKTHAEGQTSHSVSISRTLDASCQNSDDTDVEMVSESAQGDLKKIESVRSPDLSKQNTISNPQSSSIVSASGSIKQPLVVLPRTLPTGEGFLRARSASDGEGFPSASCASLIKSGVTVTPVLNVKLQTDQPSSSENPTPSTPTIRKLAISSPKNVVFQSKLPMSKATSLPQPIILSPLSSMKLKPSQPASDVQKQFFAIKKENHDTSSTHITIPLSSLLKTSTTSPQILKLAQPLSKGPTFSVNMLNLPTTLASTKPREKRSFSADQSPARTLSLTPVNLNMGSKPGTSQQPIQLHIISPPSSKLSTSPKKGKSTAKPPSIALHTLQAALSSGKLNQPTQQKPATQSDTTAKQTKMDSSIGQQQYVLATVVNPKGKQQLALINPSALTLGSSKKLITITSPKGQKPALGPLKQATVLKTLIAKPSKATEKSKPSQQENISVQTKQEPIYKVIGEQILLHKGLHSLVDDILPIVVKKVPLVDEKRDLTEFPFCALTEAEFLDWNIGKQRAAEWQRAVLVRKVLEYIQTKSELLKKCELPSKRFIVDWCLRHGYSVFTDEFEEEDEKNHSEDGEAKENIEMKDIPTTITTAEELLKLLEEKMGDKGKKGNNEEDGDGIFVDVVSIESPQREMTKIKLEGHEENAQGKPENDLKEEVVRKIQGYAESPEVAAIEEMTREIGVNLHRMYGTPACHIVISRALQQFTEELLRKALSSALTKRDGTILERVCPEEISILDVVAAIKETPNFDFLTDKNFASNA